MELKDKLVEIENAAEAGALGDSIGAAFEFLPEESFKRTWDSWEEESFGSWPTRSDVIKRPTKELGIPDLPEGAYTDDTEHSLVAIELILESMGRGVIPTANQFAYAFADEFEGDFVRRGFPRHGHGSIMAFYESYISGGATEESLEGVRSSQRERELPGNASVMRGWVAGIYSDLKDLKEAAYNLADASHPHNEARASAHAVALAYHYLLYIEEGENYSDMFDFVLENLDDSLCKTFISNVRDLPKLEEASPAQRAEILGPQPVVTVSEVFQKEHGTIWGLNCFAPHTVAAIFWVLENSKDTYDGIKKAITLAGDTDSVASVVAAFLSVRHGLKSVPSKLRVTQEYSRERLERFFNELEE